MEVDIHQMYCKSRWIGIHTSCAAIISSWHAVLSLKNNLIVSGYGCVKNEDVCSDDEADDEALSSDDSSDSKSYTNMNWFDLFTTDDTDTGNTLAPKKNLITYYIESEEL